MIDWITLQFAGLWPLVGMFGFSSIGVLALLGAAWFSPVFKKEIMFAAGVLATALVVYGIGVKHGQDHIQQRWDTAERLNVEKGERDRAAIERAPLPDSVRNDRYNRDHQKR